MEGIEENRNTTFPSGLRDDTVTWKLVYGDAIDRQSAPLFNNREISNH
jgi:hypothetical protein